MATLQGCLRGRGAGRACREWGWQAHLSLQRYLAPACRAWLPLGAPTAWKGGGIPIMGGMRAEAGGYLSGKLQWGVAGGLGDLCVLGPPPKPD